MKVTPNGKVIVMLIYHAQKAKVISFTVEGKLVGIFCLFS